MIIEIGTLFLLISQTVMLSGSLYHHLVPSAIQSKASDQSINPTISVKALVKLEGWEDIVTINSSDMRSWNAPEEADILVNELLGSFGDNELSPERLDGADRFLKPDGISIPSSYTGLLQPVTASKLYNDVKARKDPAHFETASVVNIHNAARLALSQPCVKDVPSHFTIDCVHEIIVL